MERAGLSRKILATKISYISNIMVYYGYVHECAELYLQLCKDSRSEFNKNSHTITNIIMKHKNSRWKMEFKSEFSSKQAKFLLANYTYSYFRLNLWLHNSTSYTNLVNFISNLKHYSTDLFNKVSIKYSANNHK